MVIRFFLKKLEDPSVCACAQINIQTLQMPNNSDKTV